MTDKEPLSDRIKGHAAHEAGKRRGITGAFLSLVGGKLLPTRHSEYKLVTRGDEWDEKQDKGSAAILNRGAEGITKVHGIEAKILMLIDEVGSGDKRMARLAALELAKWSFLTKNSDAIQNGLIQRGMHTSQRATEVQVWQDALSQPGNEEILQTVLDNRPDLTPDVMQAAEHKAGFGYANLGGVDRAKLDQLSKLSLEEAINRYFNITTISKLDVSFFQEIARLKDKDLSALLLDRMRSIKSIGEVGERALGRFAGGKFETAIDAALAPVGRSFSTI